MSGPFFADLRLVIRDGAADITAAPGEAGVVSGLENLVQALTLRLLIDRGELAALGHSRYGTRIRELIGESNDRSSRELLRRYVRRSLLDDPRVAEVVEVVVTPRSAASGAVSVTAVVLAVSGERAMVAVTLDA